MIYLFTGSGKGKTSAALGMAYRAGGYGFKSVVIQFLKSKKTGEVKKAESDPMIDIYQYGKKNWTDFGNLLEIDYQLAQQGFKKAQELVEQKPFMIVLDEFNLVVSKGLVEITAVIDFLNNSCENIQVVLTGRDAPSELVEIADLVTEFREIKHPYRENQLAIKGLDY